MKLVDRRVLLSNQSKVLLAVAAAFAAPVALARVCHAATYTLQSGNSVININPFGDSTSVDGLYSWTVDGITQMRDQGYVYRINNTGAGSNVATLSPSTLVSPVQLSNTTTAGGAPNQASVSYQTGTLTVNTRYTLTGGAAGSNFSDLVETMVVGNTATTPLTFSMVDYTDLNLGGNGANDSLTISAAGATTIQTNPAGWTSIATASTPSSYEAATYPTLFNTLNSGAAFPLTDIAAVASADVSNAVEYDQSIKAGGQLTFTVNQQIIGPGPSNTVPEPVPAFLLLGMGGMFLLRPRRDDQAHSRALALAVIRSNR